MWDAGRIAYVVAGSLALLFAGWLLYLSPRQRASRAFALLMGGMGTAFLTGLLEENVAWWSAQHHTLTPMLYSGIGIATVFFLCVYPRPRGWIGRSRWGGTALLAAWAALAVVLALRPELYTDGPLFFLENAWSVSAGLLYVLLAIDVARTPDGPLRRPLLLVLAGMLVSPFVFNGMLVFNDLGRRVYASSLHPQFGRAAYAVEEAVLLLAVAAVGIVLVHAARSRRPAHVREAAALAALAVVALAAAALVTFLAPPPSGEGNDFLTPPQEILDAFSIGVALPLFVGYALLKHRLFDIDVKVRWTISRGTIAVTFVGVFFVASQMAQNFLEDSMGWALGGIVAGLLLFAITPIQRVADHVADVAMPIRASSERDKRLETYRLALAIALADRVISRDEERHLAHLAEHLGLAHTETLALRESVERELGAPVGAG